MKKTGILNSEISRVIGELGHTDKIVVCDCGLPIPANVKRIDLALKLGTPSFMETLKTILIEMQVEKAYVATEMTAVSPQLVPEIKAELQGVPLITMSHEALKDLTREAKAIIRTGEATPYANIILEAGVIF